MALASSYTVLSTSSAHALAFFFSSCYVGSIYISKNARLSFAKNVGTEGDGEPREKLGEERWRNDPDVIRARILAVSVATSLCCCVVFALLTGYIHGYNTPFNSALDAAIIRLGLVVEFKLRSLLPHLVTPVLYFGPFYVCYLGGGLPLQKHWSFQDDVLNRFFCWQGARNYFAGPITEELVFRSCVLAVYQLSGASKTKMIFLAPLSFGLAHVHHAWDTWNRYGRTANAAKRAVLMSLFQLAYTTLFGYHCSYLFLRTGSVLPSITAHMFCNVMGLPGLIWEIKAYPRNKKEIIFMYIIGIIGFIYTMGAWTRNETSLYWCNQFEGLPGSY